MKSEAVVDVGPSSTCPCGTRTEFRCACGDWWCGGCLKRHTSGLEGRCPKMPKAGATQ